MLEVSNDELTLEFQKDGAGVKGDVRAVSYTHLDVYKRQVSTGGTVTSRFGPRESPGGIGSRYHQGLDIRCV